MKQNVISQADIVKMAAKAGAQAALERVEKENAKEKQVLADSRLNSIKLLLKSYRDIKLNCANSVYEASQLDEDAIDILNFMYDPQNKSDYLIESIKGNALRSEIMVCHVDTMLKKYEEICRRSKNPECMRHFDVVYDFYISTDESTPTEIAVRHGISERTVYRDIDKAAEKLSCMVFGMYWMLNSKVVEPVDY